MESEMALLVTEYLLEHGLEHRVASAMPEGAEIRLGNHFWHEQNQQRSVEAKQMPQHDKARVTPMLLQQRRIELLQHARHQPGVFLLLFDEQIDRCLVIAITCGGSPVPQMAAFAAFAHLEALQRANQRPAQP